MQVSQFRTYIERFRFDDDAKKALEAVAAGAKREGFDEIDPTALYMMLPVPADVDGDRYSVVHRAIRAGEIQLERIEVVFEQARSAAIQRVRSCFPLRMERITTDDLWDALGFPEYKFALATTA